MASHLPDFILQITQIHNWQGVQKARDHENDRRESRRLEPRQEVIQDQKDGPRRDFLEGIEPRLVDLQIQIGRRRGPSPVHGFRIAEQLVRGESCGENPVRSNKTGAEDEPQGIAGGWYDGLFHGFSVSVVLD